MTEINTIDSVLFGMQNRTSGPYLAAINRIHGDGAQSIIAPITASACRSTVALAACRASTWLHGRNPLPKAP
jgi:hypothetical protein